MTRPLSEPPARSYRDWLKANRRSREWTIERTFLMRASMESGYCCCGDKIEDHNMGSGHSPVDAGTYDLNCQVEEIDQALHPSEGPSS